MACIFEHGGDVTVLKSKILGSTVVERQRAQKRIWIVWSAPFFGCIGLGEQCAADSDIGARLEELFGAQVKESGVFRIDLEEADGDGDSVSKKPAHPQDGLLFGPRLPSELNFEVQQASRSRNLLGPIDADGVRMKRRLGSCDSKHSAGGRLRSAALNEGNHLGCGVTQVGVLGYGRWDLCLGRGYGHTEENR